MKNKRITCAEDGKKYWVTDRVVGCSLFVYRQIGVQLELLIVKRSEKCSSFPGRWCCPCGFIDADETGEQCAARECYEETGYVIPVDKISLVDVSTSPKEFGQHICLRYAHLIDEEAASSLMTDGVQDTDEIDEVIWVPMKELTKYNLCFGHFPVAMNIIADLLLEGIKNNIIKRKM